MSVRAFMLLSLVFLSSGGCSMWSSEKKMLQLQWEAPAGREAQVKIVMVVDGLEDAEKGLFGSVENHPSMAHAMPNPVAIKGTVIHHPSRWSAAIVALRYPKYKMSDAKVKDRIALALVPENICICAARVPDDIDDGKLGDWLSRWTCSD